MWAFVVKHWKVLALACLVWLVYSWGCHNTDQAWQIKWQQRDNDAITAQAEQERKFREREQGLQQKLNNQQVEHDQRLAEMQSLQLDARADADGLRKQLEELRKRLSSSPSGTSGDSWQLPSVTRAAMVLSELYGSCVGHRQELAAAADESRRRGLAVEQMYDRARGQ